MNIFKQKENARFSNKTIILFMLPLLFEQTIISLISMADTFMVSSFGETAVAGVALVTNVDNFVKQVFAGLAVGSSVVLSQYIGAASSEGASKSLKASIHSTAFLTIAASLIVFILKKQVLSLMFGAVEKDVMNCALTYFSITLFSYPFMTLYSMASASYRAMGNSKIALRFSFLMMFLSLGLKYVFIFILKFGIAGAALSNLMAYLIVSIFMIIGLHDSHNKAHLVKFFVIDYDFKMIKTIYKVGVPNGIENGMFQLGFLLIQSLVSTFGTVSLAAHSLANGVTPLIHTFQTTFKLGIITFVAQCMGAGDTEDAEFYMKHILKMNYFFVGITTTIAMFVMPYVIRLYNLSDETTVLAMKLFYIYASFSLLFYPSAFTLPNALRGAGDTKFTMVSTTATMFTVRIGLAYVFGLFFNLGIKGTWLAMVLEWVVKTIIYATRMKKGKWKNIKVIETKKA